MTKAKTKLSNISKTRTKKMNRNESHTGIDAHSCDRHCFERRTLGRRAARPLFLGRVLYFLFHDRDSCCYVSRNLGYVAMPDELLASYARTMWPLQRKNVRNVSELLQATKLRSNL